MDTRCELYDVWCELLDSKEICVSPPQISVDQDLGAWLHQDFLV